MADEKPMSRWDEMEADCKPVRPTELMADMRRWLEEETVLRPTLLIVSRQEYERLQRAAVPPEEGRGDG